MQPSAAPLQFAPESVSTLQVVWHKRASKIIERLVFPTLLSWTGMAGASYHSCTGQGMPGISVRVLPAPFLVNNFVPTAYVFNSLKPAVRMTRSVCDHFGTTKTADMCSGSLRLQREKCCCHCLMCEYGGLIQTCSPETSVSKNEFVGEANRAQRLLSPELLHAASNVN